MSGQATRPWRGFALALSVAVVVLIADQVSKAVVMSTLGPGGDRTVITVVPNLVHLLYVENTGAAFGVFQGGGAVLTPLALVVVAVLAIAFRRLIAESLWLSLALGLQFGGAIGNVLSRVRLGYVVDFINVPHWPTFNVADSAITVGVVILGFFLFARDFSTAPSEAVSPPVPPAGAHVGDDGSNPAD